MSEIKKSASYIIEKLAKKSGVVSVEVFAVENSNSLVRTRLGKTETIESSLSSDIGIRLIMSKKSSLSQAIVSTNILKKDVVDKSIEAVFLMAKSATPDKFIQVVDKANQAKKIKDLELFDTSKISAKRMLEMCEMAEVVALSTKGITNSEGAELSSSKNKISLITSGGFFGEYKASNYSFYLPVVAGKNDKMETDYDYSATRFFEKLKSPEDLGKAAAKRALRRLNPRKVKTQKVPIIFEARVAREMVEAVADAVNGSSIVRKTSFLKDKFGKQVFSKAVNIIDNPMVLSGLSSRPFDGEGIVGEKISIIEKGILKSLLLDSKTSYQLKMKNNGRASRGILSPPSPSATNIYMENGKKSVDSMISSIKNGFYVTDAFGMGVNLITGDYSQGASGFWIENGKISYPVSEVTIAGNLTDVFMNIIPANDLEFLYSVNSPTLFIEGMTVAGT